MNPPKKTIHQRIEEQEQAANHQSSQQESVREFASVEEVLRHDASHTPVPPTVAYRLQQSIAQSPAQPRRSWWRRLLGS
jgi:hypothetical protein